VVLRTPDADHGMGILSCIPKHSARHGGTLGGDRFHLSRTMPCHNPCMTAGESSRTATTRHRTLRAQTLKRAAANHDPCYRCGKDIDYTQPYRLEDGGINPWYPTADHVRRVMDNGTDSLDNYAPAHYKCNVRDGAAHGNKARKNARNNAQNVQGKRFMRAAPPSTPMEATTYPPSVEPGPLDVGYALPRYETELNPNCAGSYWGELEEWVKEQGIELRPWQRRVAERAFEHDAEGRLLWRTVVVSTPRQSGKSWLIKAVAMARCAHPHLFGDEPQTCVHVANRHLAARRIHSQAWGWAGKQGLAVRTAMGSERIIWPDGGSWDALTLTNVYGSTAGLIFLDEVWDIAPEDYREGIRPTQVARAKPQLWALSTSHRRASGLMGELFSQGREGVGRTLVMDWGADPYSDHADPGTWPAAAPHWDEARAEEMQMMSGSPGFLEQWLNVWPDAQDETRWLPRRLTVGTVTDVPLVDNLEAVCGLESMWGVDEDPRRFAVVAVSGETIKAAKVTRHATIAEAITEIGDRPVITHPAVVAHLAANGRTQGVTSVQIAQQRAGTQLLREHVSAGAIKVEGVTDEEWAGVRIGVTSGGEVIDGRRSVADVTALKALSWALWKVERARHVGPVMVA